VDDDEGQVFARRSAKDRNFPIRAEAGSSGNRTPSPPEGDLPWVDEGLIDGRSGKAALLHVVNKVDVIDAVAVYIRGEEAARSVRGADVGAKVTSARWRALGLCNTGSG